MKFGAYDQKIQFIEFGQQPDGAGGYEPVEEVVLTTLARINQLKQSGQLEQVHMKLPTAYRVRVIARRGLDITVGMLVKWRGVSYKVVTAPTVESVRLVKELIFDIAE